MVAFSIILKSQLEGAKRLDAEYYQPEYLALLSAIIAGRPHNLLSLTDKIDVGFVSSMASHFQESGIPLLRTQNVQEFYLDLDRETVFIDEDFHQSLKKSILKPGYVLLARSGSIGAAAVVPEDISEANSADIILIKTKDELLPEFLATFLNSKYGRFQIERASSGGLQGHINLFSLEQLLVPEFRLNEQQVVKEIVKSGFRELEHSKSFYSQAEQTLLKELGLEGFGEDGELWSVVRFSEVKAAHRMDAEYFQPKYARLFRQLEKHSARLLGELVTMKKGIEPGSEAYTDEGKLFIRVSNISQFGLADKDQKYVSDQLYKEMKDDYAPKIGEILLTKDATPGIACVLTEKVEGVVSGGVLRLKLKESIDAEYLALCINSLVGHLQAERDAGGSIIAHWKPEQIKQMRIPILPESIQQNIAELVRASHAARARAHELLESAKRMVEEWVERGA